MAKDRVSYAHFDERAEPESVAPPRREYKERPGVSTELAHELGVIVTRLDQHDVDIDELQNAHEATGRNERVMLEQKVALLEAEKKAATEKEAAKKDAVEKERRDKRYDLSKNLALLAIGALLSAFAVKAVDCKPGTLTVPANAADAGVK